MINKRYYKVLESENEHQSKDRWMISYADLMTLLLALFVVLYAASDSQRAKAVADSLNNKEISGNGILPGGTSVFDQNKVEQNILENPILKDKTNIRQSESGLVISLSEAGFFAPGEAEITKDTENIIQSLLGILKESKTKIRIEGHTDSIPISNAKYPSNWELSTARASAVLVKFTEFGILPERLSAAGYAGFQPIADNSTAEGRSQNRRVDVVLLTR